jgi:Fe-S-cluster-containing hydrogenase component 2
MTTSTRKRHTHNLLPQGVDPKKPTHFGCSSCAFLCTVRAVAVVRAQPEKHRAIRRVPGRKQTIWDL